MNTANREKVNQYLNRKTVSSKPLAFDDSYYRHLDLRYSTQYNMEITTRKLATYDVYLAKIKKLNLSDAILATMKVCMELNTNYVLPSGNISRRRQCYNGRRRTIVDIWRILKYYYDENIDLFDVMHEMYKLTKDINNRITSSFCSVIRKRTFRQDNRSSIYPHRDEFGLQFEDWKEI